MKIFIPEEILNCKTACFLYGHIAEDEDAYVTRFVDRVESLPELTLLGRLTVETAENASQNVLNSNGVLKRDNFFHLCVNAGVLTLLSLEERGRVVDSPSVTIIVYPKTIFQSEFLSSNDNWTQSKSLRQLWEFAQPDQALHETEVESLTRTDNFFTQNLQVCRQLLDRYTQLKCNLPQQTLGQKNQLIAIMFDFLLGLVFLHVLRSLGGTSHLLDVFLLAIETVVGHVQSLIVWLMGIPAGLKLNQPLSTVLGKFFLYHLYLWRTYMDIIEPIVAIVVSSFAFVGMLGFSFQLALLGDLMTLATFHCYCFYVYAARLYGITTVGLISTLRMFSGRKYNPLRQRVDSGRFTTDQLCVGTLVATTLLLLLPTTLVYYIVFLSLRLVVLSLHGTLRQLIWMVNHSPPYAIALWLANSPTVAGEVQFDIITNPVSQSATVLKLRAVRLGLLDTLKLANSDSSPILDIQWSSSVKKVIGGSLLST